MCMPFNLANPLAGNCQRKIKSPGCRRDNKHNEMLEHSYTHKGNNYKYPLEWGGHLNSDLKEPEGCLDFLC